MQMIFLRQRVLHDPYMPNSLLCFIRCSHASVYAPDRFGMFKFRTASLRFDGALNVDITEFPGCGQHVCFAARNLIPLI